MEKGGTILELTGTFTNQVVSIQQPDLILLVIFDLSRWELGSLLHSDPGPTCITSDLRPNHCWFIQARLLDTSPRNVLQMPRSYYCFPLEFLISTMFFSGLSRALPKLGNTFTMSFCCYCLLQYIYGEQQGHCLSGGCGPSCSLISSLLAWTAQWRQFGSLLFPALVSIFLPTLFLSLFLITLYSCSPW